MDLTGYEGAAGGEFTKRTVVHLYLYEAHGGDVSMCKEYSEPSIDRLRFRKRVSGLRTVPTRQSKYLLSRSHRARGGIEPEEGSYENQRMSSME
jgi:hypothetical protein